MKPLQSCADHVMLTGQTVLIVETEFLIALDIQRVLEFMGAGQTVFARTTIEALDAAARWPGFGLALVEIHHERDDDLALLQGLKDAGVALVLLTADIALRRGCASFPGTPVVMKPFLEEELASAIKQALTS
jgi:CheY-like chemotaxis protein